jgi:hypothetical protein
MAKLNDDTHVLLDGAAKVYLRGNSKRWQATFQIDGHWVRISSTSTTNSAPSMISPLSQRGLKTWHSWQ